MHCRPAADAACLGGVDVLEAEGDRVHVRRVGERVDRLLRGERRLGSARCPQPDSLQESRVAVDDLARHAPVDVLVERPGRGRVDLAARSCRKRRPRELGSRLDHLRPAVVVGRVVVGDDVPGRVDPGPDVGRLGRAELIPAVLVPAHELNPDRLADHLRHERRGDADVVVGAVAVGARAGEDLDANRGRRHAKCRRDRRPGLEVRALRGTEERRAVRRDLGDRAVRAERAVHLVRREVARRDGLRRPRKRRSDVAGVHRDRGALEVRRVTQGAVQVAAARQLRRRRPT